MTKEIRQLPEVTTPATTDWYVLQKSSNNQTSRVSGENVIPGGSIKSPKLGLSAVADATNGVKSQANVGNAGGTMYYINLGGIKMLWCNGALATVGAGNTTLSFTLPVFFTTIQAIIPSTAASSPASSSNVTLLSFSTSAVNCNLYSSTNVSMAASIFIIGT